MFELSGHTQEEEPVRDCDCHRCAIAERDRLRKLLEEASECIADWGLYASEYFQKKHDLDGDIRRFREAANLTPNSVLDRTPSK